jgi:hypothetical protein
MNRRIVRRAVALGGLWAAISAAALVAPGCYGRNCEAGVETFGLDAGEGVMVDENTWMSGPFNEPWLWFPRQRTYVFEVPAFAGRVPYDVDPYVSATLDPMNTAGGNGVKGAGNIALLQSVLPNRVAVRNDTCSDYYLRITAQLPPLPPALDGGAPDVTVRDADVPDADLDDAEAGP